LLTTPERDNDQTIGYYSLLRFVPDPVRDEAVNIGLFLVDAHGRYSRFDGEVPRGLLRGMRRSKEVGALEHWIEQAKNVYAPVGEKPLVPGEAVIDRRLLERWAAQFGASLRVTAPTIATGESLADLWNELYGRLVSRQNRPLARVEEEIAPTLAAHLTPSDERDRVANALVRTMQKWHNFDQDRIQLQGLFPGRKARHQADVAVVNGTVTAVAKALPLISGTEQDHIAARALLLDAAFDLPNEVVKLAIYDEPPAERVALLDESRSVLGDYPNTLFVSRTHFPALEDRFAARFFPEAH
jgi:hypothetical protein